jgi:hypothetical protein
MFLSYADEEKEKFKSQSIYLDQSRNVYFYLSPPPPPTPPEPEKPKNNPRYIKLGIVAVIFIALLIVFKSSNPKEFYKYILSIFIIFSWGIGTFLVFELTKDKFSRFIPIVVGYLCISLTVGTFNIKNITDALFSASNHYLEDHFPDKDSTNTHPNKK